MKKNKDFSTFHEKENKMTLNHILHKGTRSGTKMITFYHVSRNVEAFKSFFREGAKAIGKGVGGQTDGFFLWTNERAAKRHILYLNDEEIDENQRLSNGEAIVIGVSIPKASISYPVWQQDMESSHKIFQLWSKYGNFINKKAHDLDIPFNQEKQPYGWDFSKITGFSYKKHCHNLFQKEYYDVFFEGIKKNGKKDKKTLRKFQDDLDKDDNQAEDSVKFQILTDWLYKNNYDFRKDYNALMQDIIFHPYGFPLKYTGKKPLPIASAKYVKVNKDGSLKTVSLFEAPKGPNQVCPFLTLGIAKKQKE